MRNIAAFIVGSLFGAGLLISGMTDTEKVQGWLDIFGDWDPTLAFVMGGAIIPMAIAWRFTQGRSKYRAQTDHRIRNVRCRMGACGPLPWSCACVDFFWRHRWVCLFAGDACWHVYRTADT